MLQLQLREIASDLTGDRTLRQAAAWRLQYRTTNLVYLSRGYVLKIYGAHASLVAEEYFYSRRAEYGFNTATPICFLDSPGSVPVAIFHRVPGRPLSSLISGGLHVGRHLVQHLVGALLQFELLPGFLGSDQADWSYRSSILPLCTRLQENGFETAAMLLSGIAASADSKAAALPRVPCFDLYPGNIIIDGPHMDEVITHVDFDKAHRAVPAGEQLSHIALVPGFRSELRRLLPRYAAAIGVGGAELSTNLRFAVFLRACACLRDSLAAAGSEDSEPAHRAQRTKARTSSIQLAVAALAAIRRGIGLSNLEVAAIARGFDEL